jgi:hypothetical protein
LGGGSGGGAPGSSGETLPGIDIGIVERVGEKRDEKAPGRERLPKLLDGCPPSMYIEGSPLVDGYLEGISMFAVMALLALDGQLAEVYRPGTSGRLTGARPGYGNNGNAAARQRKTGPS